MISINLIPDVKLEMLRAQKLRNFAISVSILAGVAAGAVVLAMALVLGAQAAVETVTDGTIKSEYKKLSAVNGINDTLTIQNQLSQISSINEKKTLDSRLLDVLSVINPAAPNDMKFSKVTLNPTDSTLTIEGSAVGGFAATEVFRKTILNTKVEGKEGDATAVSSVPLTDDVKLQDTSYGQDSSGATVLRYTVVFSYPKALFSNSLQEVRIVTPTNKVDVTDSKTRVPDSLFTQPATTTGGGN